MIRKSLFSLFLVAALVVFSSPSTASDQAMQSALPFKVGTFAIDDVPTIGLVMQNDELIVELAAANSAMELLPRYSKVNMPEDMIWLISQY